jgi:hypothetical protein
VTLILSIFDCVISSVWAKKDLEGPPGGSPKLFLAPAKGGGAPPDACRVDGATAGSAASPSMLAGGRRGGAGKGGRREGRLH